MVSPTLSPEAARVELSLRNRLKWEDELIPGGPQFAIDGMVPDLVAVPQSLHEVQETLAASDRAGAAVVPWGGGLHIGLGNRPARYTLAVCTTSLNHILEHEPADLTITVEAGITMGRLQAHLAGDGQFLPIDAPADATIGGVLAANVSGPSRHAYGLPRDWLIGCRVAHADGSISKGGGRVVKNVAGYDMPKLAVGSLGTLGVIVEATLKVAPSASGGETLVVHCASLAAAAGLVFAADDRGLALRAVALLDGDRAAFWLAGPPAAVERTSRELRDLTGSDAKRLEGRESEDYWAALVDAPGPEGGVSLKVSLPPAAVAGFVDRCDFAAIAYPTTGLVLAQLGPASPDAHVGAIEQARALAVASGGSLVVTSAPVEVKRRIDVWGDAGDALPLMRRLKEQFDPRRTLNPGRYVGGL